MRTRRKAPGLRFVRRGDGRTSRTIGLPPTIPRWSRVPTPPRPSPRDIVHPLVDRLFGDSIRKALAALVKNDDVRALCNRYRLAGNSRNSSTWQNGSGDENDVVGAVSKKIWTLPLLRIWFWNPCWSRSDRVNSAVVARLTQMFDSPSPVFTPSRKSASNYKARNINQERDISGKNASCSNLPIYAG